MQAIAILKASCSPAGRINRRGFLHLALIILALQLATYGMMIGLGQQADALILRLFDFATLWICLTAATKRLHDTGRGAIWILYTVAGSLAFSVFVIVAAILLFGQTVLLPESTAYLWLIAIATLPAFAATLWLHFVAGEQTANRFGPVPDHTGFASALANPQLTPAAVDR